MLPFSMFAVVIVVALILLFLQLQESLARAWAPGSNADHWYWHRTVCDLVDDDAVSTR